MKVLLTYLQRGSTPRYTIEERFGQMSIVQQNPRDIDFEQEEFVDLDVVNKRIKELKSFSNRKYHTFKILVVTEK